MWQGMYVLLRRALYTSFKLLQKEIRSSLTVLTQQQQQKNHKEKYTQWRGRMAGGVYTKQAKEEEEKEQQNYDIRIEFVKIQIQVGKKSHRFLEQCQPNIFGAVIHVGFPRKSCKNKKL